MFSWETSGSIIRKQEWFEEHDNEFEVTEPTSGFNFKVFNASKSGNPKKKKNVIGKLNTKSRQINSTENLAENKEHTGVDGNIRQIGLIQKAMVWMITEGFPA